MGLLTVIDNVPLYDSIREAKTWAKQYNLTGYHVHYFNNRRGYMGGSSHDQITSALAEGVQTALSALELTTGNFIVTSSEIQFYQTLAQQIPTPVSQEQSIEIVESNQSVPQPNIPQQTPPQSTPMSQPSIPSYTPPSTGGSSSGGGGGY